MDRFHQPHIFNGHVRAFFTKRSEGVDLEKISKILSIKSSNIYIPLQKHTDKVSIVKSNLEPKIADAVVTKKEGILIGVQVADCVPILLFDKRTVTVGVVHAGWRSTAAQIIKKTVTLMVTQFDSSPEDILIALGPSIRWSCYNVGLEVKNAIYNATGDGKYYTHVGGQYCIDLSSANMYQAIATGIPKKNIWISHECTYCNPQEYYSYRYEKCIRGSQGGFIGIF